MVLGETEYVNALVNEGEQLFKQHFANRIEQLIYILKDPIARCSSYIPEYLLTAYQTMKAKQLTYSINFVDYCKIYLSVIANCRRKPMDTVKLAEAMDDPQHKYSLHAEHFAMDFTGANDDIKYSIAVLLDNRGNSGADKFRQPFMKINDAVQVYRPVRTYPGRWTCLLSK